MRLGLILREAFTGLSKNASMVVSVILVTFISLTFVGVAVLLQGQITSMKGYWYDRAQVQIYFCSAIDQSGNCQQAAASDEEIAAVRGELETAPLAEYIESVEYLTPEEVLAETREVLADNPVVDTLTPELVGAVARVTMVDPANADIVVESVAGN